MTTAPPDMDLPDVDLAGHTVTVVTASDGVSHGTREDRSGDALAARLAGLGADVADRVVVVDDLETIATAVRAAADAGSRIIMVTGGTGLGPRDVTPEAIASLSERTIPGFGEVMRATGRRSTPMADLSRSVAASLGDSLVVAVPGSPTGALESLDAVVGLFPHVLDLLAGETAHATSTKTPDGPSGVSPGRNHTDHDHSDHDHGDHDHSDHDHDVHGHDHGDTAPQHPDDAADHAAACDLAHGDGNQPPAGTLMAVFASPLSALLLAWGRELGYHPVLVDPRLDADRTDLGDVTVAATTAAANRDTDIVVTDHHRDELVDLLDGALDTPARYIGLIGSPRVAPPHADALRGRGRTEAELDRVVRPIGIDIGSKTPAEIAVSTLAELVARRHGKHPAT